MATRKEGKSLFWATSTSGTAQCDMEDWTLKIAGCIPSCEKHTTHIMKSKKKDECVKCMRS